MLQPSKSFLCGYHTGLLFEPTTGEIIEIAIKLYCIVVGAFFILKGYLRLNASAAVVF
jgi:hypothetical protein